MNEPTDLPPMWVDATADPSNSIEDAETGLSRVCAYQCGECPFSSSAMGEAVYDPEKIQAVLEEVTEANSYLVCASSGAVGSEFPPAICAGYLEARDDTGEYWYKRSWRPRMLMGEKQYVLVEPPRPAGLVI